MRSLPHDPLDNAHIPAAFANRPRSSMLDAARAGVQSSFAVVGYNGSRWHIKHRGEDNLVKDARGSPIAVLDVVIVGVASGVSKTYYQKAYVSGDDSAPDCFSIDGVVPDAASPVKQNDVCGTCPRNQWGSRVTDAGKRAKACADNRRIALVPSGDIPNKTLGGPMLLRLPPTSLPNLASYSDLLDRKGVDFPYVVTALGFDATVSYPKITFEATGFLDDEQAAEIVEVMNDPLIGRMLHEAAPTESAAAPVAGARRKEPDQEAAEEKAEEAEPLDRGKPSSVFQRRSQVIALPVPQKAAPEPEADEEEQPEEKVTAAPAAPAPRGRARRPATQPMMAPPNLANAIDDLLDESA